MSSFTPEQHRELLRLMEGLRRSIDAAISQSAPVEVLSALADRAGDLADALGRSSGDRPFPRYGDALSARDPNAMLPFSPITGRYNPLAPPVELELVPGTPPRVLGRVAFGRPYEGPPSCVHGSIIASVYDQLLALAAIATDAGGPTATLTVRYLQPTPLCAPLQFEAWTDRVEGRKALVRGICRAGSQLVSECEGVFVRFDAARLGWARAVDTGGSRG